jgi:hypothetical protein
VDAPRPDARRLRAGDLFVWTVVNGSVQLPAVLRTHCKLVESIPKCDIGGNQQVAAGMAIVVPGWGEFVINEVRGDTAPVILDVDIRFMGRPDLLALLHRGDVGLSSGPSDRAAVLAVIGSPETMVAQVVRRFGNTASGEDVQVQERIAAVSATLHLSADATPDGFEYRSQPIKVGAPVAFETTRYIVRGTIVGVRPRAD